MSPFSEEDAAYAAVKNGTIHVMVPFLWSIGDVFNGLD